MNRCTIFFLASALVTPAAHAAHADARQDLADCAKLGDEGNYYAIPICTSALKSSALSDADRVQALVNRSRAYRNAREFDRAIADCKEALTLDPNAADTEFECGLAYGGKGDYDAGIASFTRVIEIAPDSEGAYVNRGNLYNQKAAYALALADYYAARGLSHRDTKPTLNRGMVYYNEGRFAESFEVLREAAAADPEDPYPVLWLALAAKRTGHALDLQGLTWRMALEDWPGPLLRFLNTGAEVSGETDRTYTPDQDCEMAFYLGEWAAITGAKNEAKQRLQHAAHTCPKTFIERAGAVAALRRLEP